jgi:hypothetical protein
VSFGTHSHYDRASSTRDSSIAQQIHHRDTTNEITHALASMAQPLVPTANPTDPTAALPSELSTKIFKLVALHSSADLAACRLVSSAWRQHSDPFLITTAVVAERPKALQKLDELLAHPYFRTQIKTLVWDASTYNEYLATSYDDYKGRFGTAPHLKKYEIVRSDPTLLPQGYGSMHLPRTGSLSSLLHDERRLRSEPMPMMEESSVMGSLQNILYVEPLVYYEDCHDGWKTYAQQYQQQVQLKKDGSIEKAFLRAVQELPALKHVVFSDFKGVALAGESYIQLCKKLFGNTICPQLPAILPSVNHLRNAAYDFLKALQSSQPRKGWQSLSICRHPFEAPGFDFMEWTQGIGRLIGLQLQPNTLPDVQVLRLPITIGTETSPSTGLNALAPAFSTQSPSSSTALTIPPNPQLRALEICGSINGTLSSRSRKNYDSWAAEQQPQSIPHLLLRAHMVSLSGQSNFPRLSSLTLQGFVLETASFHDCLRVYAGTLRTLRVLDSCCIDSYAEFVAMLATSLSETLSLSGVEIYGLCFLHPSKARKPLPGVISDMAVEEMDDEVDEDMGEKMKERRALDWAVCQRESREDEFPTFNERTWPCVRPELERALLAGRENRVVRRVKAAETQGEREDWQNKPVHHV